MKKVCVSYTRLHAIKENKFPAWFIKIRTWFSKQFFEEKKNQTVEKHYKDKEAVFVYQSQINKKKYIILNTLTQWKHAFIT